MTQLRFAPRISPAPRRREPSPWPLYVPPSARALLALSPEGCRWPLGEVSDDGFRFCDVPRRRGAYCADHGRIAYRGASR